MSLSNIISLTITRETQTPTRAGFGTPMILAWGPAGAPSNAVYTSASAMADDGWATTDPAYEAAVKLFSQNPAPEEIKVIKKTSSVQTQTIEIYPRDVSELAEGDEYKITIGGESFSYTVGSGDTQDDVVNGLATDINTGSGAFTAAADTGNDVVDVTADSSGFFVYEDPQNVYLLDNTSKSGSEASDLSNAENLDPDWYVMLTPQDHSKALIEEWASEAETRSILYLAQTSDYTVPESDGSDTTSDVMSSLASSSYERTLCFWHQDLGGGAEAALAGNVLPTDPGSITWAYRTLSGIDVTTRNHVAGETGFSEIDTKGATWYRVVKGTNLTFDGQVASGEFADVMRGSDWTQARIEENVVALVANADKVPYTDDGVDQVKSEIRSVLRQGIRHGFLASDPEPTVTAPKVADVSSTDKGDRLLPDVEFEATLAGAIHKTTISGRLVL